MTFRDGCKGQRVCINKGCVLIRSVEYSNCRPSSCEKNQSGSLHDGDTTINLPIKFCGIQTCPHTMHTNYELALTCFSRSKKELINDVEAAAAQSWLALEERVRCRARTIGGINTWILFLSLSYSDLKENTDGTRV